MPKYKPNRMAVLAQMERCALTTQNVPRTNSIFKAVFVGVIWVSALLLPACVERQAYPYLAPAPSARKETRSVRIVSAFDANMTEALKSCLERQGFKITFDSGDVQALVCYAEVSIRFSIVATVKLLDHGSVHATGRASNHGNGTILMREKSEAGVIASALSEFERSLVRIK